MGLFQSTILKKHLTAEGDKIVAAYTLYAKYFHNPEIRENIRNSKEEQFQEGFLRKLFVDILGYTLHPEPDFNLITEKKNEKDARKADGAILVNSEVKAVIELKDHKTTDLKQVETQAFSYKNNHRKASYVVISNFEKLRLYIDNTIDCEEFNLFNLTKDDFAVLWICLAYENIAKDLPKHLKSESANSEDQITKKFYKDYSTFKHALYANIMTRGHDPLLYKSFDWHKEFPQVFTEKDKKAFHVTTATHDSRTSQRMIDYNVREMRFIKSKGVCPLDSVPRQLTDEDEIIITKTICEIVKEDELNVLAYNICRDHIHILMVCEEEELDKIVGKIKSMTARACNMAKQQGGMPENRQGGMPPCHNKHTPLWTQKFGYKEITGREQLYNTIEYIENNRIKHDLPENSKGACDDKGACPLAITKLVFQIKHIKLFTSTYQKSLQVF